MSVSAPRKPKPNQVEEIRRALLILDILADEIVARASTPTAVLSAPEQIELLKVAQAIAARTGE